MLENGASWTAFWSTCSLRHTKFKPDRKEPAVAAKSRLVRLLGAVGSLALALAFGAKPALAQSWKVIPPTQKVDALASDPTVPVAEIDDFKVYPDRLGYDSFGLTRYGLFLEVTFRVRNMAGRSGRVDIFFRPQGGDFISGAEGFYASIEKLVSVRRPFQSLADSDRFKDVGLFIPRDELRIPNGSYTLEAVILVRSSDKLLGRAVFSFPYTQRVPSNSGPQE